MADLSLIIKDKLSGKEFDVDVSDTKQMREIAETMRRELSLPQKDERGQIVYKLVLLRTGMFLDSAQTLREAGVRDRDTLSFWGEPVAASVSPERLLMEYRKVLEQFGDHPRVKFVKEGNPPISYTVTYQLKGPTGLAAGNLIIGTTHVVKIHVPEQYPHDKLVAMMQTPAFHPNIHSGGRVCIGLQSYTSETVADIIAKVGNYLQYREYDTRHPYPEAAYSWIMTQGGKAGPFDDVGFGA